MEWPSSDRSNSSSLPALAMVVAVMLICSAVYAWWQKSRHPVPARPPVSAVQKAPAPTTPAPETAAAPAENANPAATLHVSMSADAESWVQAWADGKSVMIGVLPPNSVKTVEALDSVRIRTGNAGGLQVTVNGKPAGPIGPNGQVRTVEISRDRVQILPPPPKPAPAPALEPL